MYRATEWTRFMPTATRRLLRVFVPVDLARIIVSMAKDNPLSAWDPYGLWARAEPEYNPDGQYGWLPMVDTTLPLF